MTVVLHHEDELVRAAALRAIEHLDLIENPHPRFERLCRDLQVIHDIKVLTVEDSVR
jgi:hypothetical protein